MEVELDAPSGARLFHPLVGLEVALQLALSRLRLPRHLGRDTPIEVAAPLRSSLNLLRFAFQPPDIGFDLRDVPLLFLPRGPLPLSLRLAGRFVGAVSAIVGPE